MKHILTFLIVMFSSFAFSQEKPSVTASELSITKWIDGTLLNPDSGSKTLAIIIAGSGPTDRDGNQNFLVTNNLKKLAVALTNNGIATFRYDKRIVKQIRNGTMDKNIKFDDFIADAISVVNYFKKQNTYKSIYVIGHSQGSLIGMIAAQEGKADGFISLAGAGQTIDNVITDQIEKTAPMFTQDTKRIFGILKTGQTTTDFPPALASVFNLDVQPFIANWMQYNPQDEIKKLNIPVLIINGTKDLQVSVDEAKLLSEASKNAQLKIIDKMNHVLFIIEGDDQENAKSYNNHAGKVSEELINSIVQFIKK
ncbi:MAG: alpha/beta hydrolase [Gelidibacter sp.]|nr:alpha/beta hydrolase [Gelidibacter sp.]